MWRHLSSDNGDLNLCRNVWDLNSTGACLLRAKASFKEGGGGEEQQLPVPIAEGFITLTDESQSLLSKFSILGKVAQTDYTQHEVMWINFSLSSERK